MVYTVSETAKLLDVAPSTLRYYDREGLLPFVERSSGGTRIFTETDLRWLKMIACLKSAGMPLKDIRRYIEMAMRGDETIDQRLQMFIDQRRCLQEQMRQLQQTLEVVEYKCWYYETARAAGSEEIPNQMTDDQLPERFRSVRQRLRASGRKM